MRILISILFLLFAVSSIFSQNALRDDLNGVYYDPTLYAQQYDVDDGSPYLDLNFKPAKIGNREKTFLIRLNGLKGTVEVWVKENQVIVLNATSGEEIKLLDGSERIYRMGSYKDAKGKTQKGYLEVLASKESYNLYKRESIAYFKKTKAEGYAPAKPARFERLKPVYYFKTATGTLPLYIPSNKKKFLALFDTKTAAKARTIIKKERLSLTKEAHLARILDHIYGE